MQSNLRTTLISLTSVVFLFAGMAFAKTKHINILYPATVGQKLQLEPGHYRIDVVNNSKSPVVDFYNHHGKLLGKVPVKVVSQPGKNSQTEIDYNTVASNHVIREISPAGWSESLYFTHLNTTKPDAKR